MGRMNRIALGGLAFLLTLGMLYHLFVRGLERNPVRPEWHVVGGNAQRGRSLMLDHGCISCHVIPGVRAARSRVGPQLLDFRSQIYIAGQLPNTPENLVRWIHDPESIIPGTAMPTTPMSEQDARDLAAYLYSVE
jgi:cytochrome c2